MLHYNENKVINVGTGQGISIKELAMLIKEVIGYAGDIVFDTDKPDGTPVKITDTGRINATGWQPKIYLRQGLHMSGILTI